MEPAAPEPPAIAGPIAAAERVQFIDILRGMALFGILAANMRAFDAPRLVYGPTHLMFGGVADRIAQGAINWLISGKFITLFSFLFGLGFAVQMTRATAKGLRFLSFYPRRLAVLFLLGAIHGCLIWWGDVLLSYSLTGFLLLLFRNRRQKTALYWSFGIMAVPLLLMIAVYVATLFGAHWSFLSPGPKPKPSELAAVVHIYSQGSPAAIIRQNFIDWKHFIPINFIGPFFLLSIFLLGLYIWRSGIVENLAACRDRLRRVCLWALPAGLVINLIPVIVYNIVPRPDKPAAWSLAINLLAFLGTPTLSAAYAAGLAVLIQEEAWRRRLAPFGAVGRMALTNYLMQSVVCTLFFYSYTTGLFGRVGPAIGLIPTFALYAAQVYLSTWWLARYRFGPMEWVWRSLTYGRRQPMRLRDAAAPAEAAGYTA